MNEQTNQYESPEQHWCLCFIIGCSLVKDSNDTCIVLKLQFLFSMFDILYISVHNLTLAMCHRLTVATILQIIWTCFKFSFHFLNFKDTMSLLQPTSNSVNLCRNYEYVTYMYVHLWNSNISSVLVFKLCKETCLSSRLHCQTLLSDWLTFFFTLVITYIKLAVCSGSWAFVYINNRLLVIAKIKLI